jgi:NAD(P)-dependent dehydrogenase (short-subunit alcohol dehydrogenase family)
MKEMLVTGRLKDRVTIVTGAGLSVGIGAHTSRRFAQKGARVILTDILDAEGKQTANAMSDQKLDVEYRHLDVADEENWKDVVHYCTRKLGTPSILVNNAGVFNGTPLHEENLERWNQTLAVTLTSVFLGMGAVIPLMIENGGGSIVNISSIWGLVGAKAASACHASKGGVTLLTKNTATAYAKEGIRVNSDHPGGVDTKIHGAVRSEECRHRRVTHADGATGLRRRGGRSHRIPRVRSGLLDYRHCSASRWRLHRALTHLETGPAEETCLASCEIRVGT